MTMQDKLEAVKNIQDYQVEISYRLEEIIRNTYDYKCRSIEDFNVKGKIINVIYTYVCRGEGGAEYVCIPREWLDDGFDYKAAFKEEMREIEEERKKAEQEDAERAKKKCEEEEYKKYLELKEKYENKSEE